MFFIIENYSLSIDEINENLRIAMSKGRDISSSAKRANPMSILVKMTPTKIVVTANRFAGKTSPQRYIIMRDGSNDHLSTASAYKQFTKKIGKNAVVEMSKEFCKRYTSSALLYSKYTEETYVPYAICYDCNKAYLSALQSDMPDTTKFLEPGFLNQDEIGFAIDGNTLIGKLRLERVEVGEWADYRFKKIPSPFTPYAVYMIDAINKAKATGDKKTETKLKGYVNRVVGNLQNHNPFLRASIVGELNLRISKLMDENTVYSNTDCICSTVPRDDLPLSNNVGDFKIEATGGVTVKGMNYWWDCGKKAQRGVCEKEIRYTFNYTNNQIEEVIINEEKSN